MMKTSRGQLRGMIVPCGIRVVSTDVFDTLLMRDRASERRRIIEGERLFAALAAERGRRASPEMLVRARLEAQRSAFRARNVFCTGEVALTAVLERQMRLVGLPSAWADDRLAIELEIEKRHLRVNAALASWLAERRADGLRIVATSDTTLASGCVAELIAHAHAHAHGADVVDRVYSSADHGATKRDGDLFDVVCRAEGIRPEELLHIGDDALADRDSPLRAGVAAFAMPRSWASRFIRRADGALAEAARRRRPVSVPTSTAGISATDAFSFGRDVLGPIVSLFCLRLWLYAEEAARSEPTALLFCARGGLGIRVAFERLVSRLELPVSVARDNLMVSRLVAARAAVLATAPAALEELGREFAGTTFADVARVLGGREYDLPGRWREQFVPSELFAMLRSGDGADILADIARQDALFRSHLNRVRRGAARVVLCDTGLYGSTQRLLSQSGSDFTLETVQFARSNYKGHGEEHFPRVAGLMTESDRYDPLRVETCILRYWHLAEALFEAAVPSTRTFSLGSDGRVRGNCGDISLEAVGLQSYNPLLRGVLDYMDSLADGGTALADADAAWRRLKHAIIWPSADDLQRLSFSDRSVDFGRPDTVEVLGAANSRGLSSLLGIRGRLWREGAVALEFPTLKPALLAAIESAYAVRGLAGLRRR